MNRNPPCYRCESTTPLPIERHGLCAPCEHEVLSKRDTPPAVRTCGKCGIEFFNDWERIQHEVMGRHKYRAWTVTS